MKPKKSVLSLISLINLGSESFKDSVKMIDEFERKFFVGLKFIPNYWDHGNIFNINFFHAQNVLKSLKNKVSFNWLFCSSNYLQVKNLYWNGLTTGWSIGFTLILCKIFGKKYLPFWPRFCLVCFGGQ